MTSGQPKKKKRARWLLVFAATIGALALFVGNVGAARDAVCQTAVFADACARIGINSVALRGDESFENSFAFPAITDRRASSYEAIFGQRPTRVPDGMMLIQGTVSAANLHFSLQGFTPNGEPFDAQSLRGPLTIVAPFSTISPCKDSIAFESLILAQVLRPYFTRPVNLIFVQIAADHDQPIALSEFRENWRLSDNDVIVAPEHADEFLRGLHIARRVTANQQGVDIAHTSFVYAISPSGDVLAMFNALGENDLEGIARTLLYLTVDSSPHSFKRELLTPMNAPITPRNQPLVWKTQARDVQPLRERFATVRDTLLATAEASGISAGCDYTSD